jgi:hypothetical protein
VMAARRAGGARQALKYCSNLKASKLLSAWNQAFDIPNRGDYTPASLRGTDS